MREIKFRELVENGSWHYWGYINDANGVPNFTAPMQSYNGRVLKSSQYTGLKDKNGVEIYEGDIVDSDGSWTIKYGSWTIKYGEARLVSGCAYWGFYGENKKGKQITLRPYIAKMREVIGNIYENSELTTESIE